jgi:Uri superfamily endonuclease
MQAQQVHDQGNSLLLERRRGAVIAGRLELTDKAAVMLSGRLPIALPAGRYLYCGSAKGRGGLKARLSRHMRRGKSVRWHVDQLPEQGLDDRRLDISRRWRVQAGARDPHQIEHQLGKYVISDHPMTAEEWPGALT